MSETPQDQTLRRIIREELEAVKSRLDSLEKRVTDGFAWTEEQFEWVSQRFDAVDEQFADLKRMLEGVIDEDFPMIDQQPKSGGPPGRQAVAARGR